MPANHGPLRALILSSASVFDGFPYGGAESSVALLGRTLADQGHDITFAAFSRIARGGNLWPRQTQQDQDGCEVALFIPMTGTRFRLVRRINASRFAAMICKLCRRKRIEVIYCTYEPEVLQAALAARRILPGVKVVMRMAGLAWAESAVNDPTARTRYDRFFNAVDAINFLDEASQELTTDRMRALNVGQGRATGGDFTLDIGVDTARIAEALANAPGPEDDGVLSLIMVARFSDYQKRQDLLVEAVALAREKVRLHLTLVGGGPDNWGGIRKRIDRLGVGDLVSLQAFVPQEELWARLAATDLVCHACDYEGVSKAVTEAMAVGRPVLASDVSPLNRMIRAGDTGFLAANTPEAWAAELVQLAGNRSGRDRVARAARDWVEHTHGTTVRALAYADAMRALRTAA
jgi:glycosyltransferase involved in cell wall biosynthesis